MERRLPIRNSQSNSVEVRRRFWNCRRSFRYLYPCIFFQKIWISLHSPLFAFALRSIGIDCCQSIWGSVSPRERRNFDVETPSSSRITRALAEYCWPWSGSSSDSAFVDRLASFAVRSFYRAVSFFFVVAACHFHAKPAISNTSDANEPMCVCMYTRLISGTRRSEKRGTAGQAVHHENWPEEAI